jgi:uncharacterized protein (DUF1810 family)
MISFDLNRFAQAQDAIYEEALGEIRAGRKRTHWMWFVFPQFAGLGASETSRYYAIGSLAEATAYLEHPLLGRRLLECCGQLCALEGLSAFEIFGSPDDMKLQSSATLFDRVSPVSVFDRVLAKYFAGRRDEKTIALIDAASRS